MEKSNKYTGVKYFEFRDLKYFKDDVIPILKVNFNHINIDDAINILSSSSIFTVKTIFTDFESKVDFALNWIAECTFNWIDAFYISCNTSIPSASAYMTKILNGYQLFSDSVYNDTYPMYLNVPLLHTSFLSKGIKITEITVNEALKDTI